MIYAVTCFTLDDRPAYVHILPNNRNIGCRTTTATTATTTTTTTTTITVAADLPPQSPHHSAYCVCAVMCGFLAHNIIDLKHLVLCQDNFHAHSVTRVHKMRGDFVRHLIHSYAESGKLLMLCFKHTIFSVQK